VVTTRRCGGAELLEEGQSGYLRDALDTTGLAEALDRMDLARARVMGEAARAAVAPYTPQSMAREYLALYARLLNR
jgi:UDP-glucose:(heptosyl)LPS alpha-1,3-glucosyltransferase